MMYNVECISNTRDKLGEGPIWVEEENSIYWVDIKRCLIHQINIKNLNKNSWDFKESIGCIAHIDDKNFITGTNKLNDDQKKKEPQAGSLFKVKMNINGFKTNKFIKKK